MTIDPELQQMLRDARRARQGANVLVRAWHALAERVNIISARHADTPPQKKGSLMLFDDLRHAFRRLLAQPGSAITCIVMLAFAIGVTSAMFAVADHMLFRPAPFKDPSRLKTIAAGKALKGSAVYLSRDYARQLRATTVFSDVAFAGQDLAIVEGRNGLRSTGTQWVSPNVFSMLGVRPIAGRTFTEEEGRTASQDLVVISERLWRKDFGADPSLVGRTILASGHPVTVVGILPLAFRFPSDFADIWRPYSIDAPPNPQADRGLLIFVRLADGIPEADAARVAAEATRSLAKDPDNHGIIFRGAADGYLDAYNRTMIGSLMAGVALVFIVICANVTNLILSRTVARRQEFGVCAALGASRRRLMTQVIVENALIGALAAAIGLACAYGLIAVTVSQLPDSFLWRTLNPITLDIRTVGVTALLAVLATVFAGVPPAWMGTSVNAIDSIRLESRGSSESRSSRLWAKSLLVGEIAIASMLLVGAGVLVGTFIELSQADSGMNPTNVVIAQVSLPSFIFKDVESRAVVADQLQQQLRAMPGITAVTLSRGVPPNGGGFSFGTMIVDGEKRGADTTLVFSSNVSPNFFALYGIRILQGRGLEPADAATDVVISTNLASTLFPGQPAVGRTFKLGERAPLMTVVGVANEVRSALSDPREDSPELYQPLSAPGAGSFTLGMRCAATCPPEAEIRARLLSVNAQAMVTKITTMDDAYMAQFQGPRTSAQLAFGFSFVALAAVAAGLFSILTYAVSRRRREFGIRSAMGADPRAIRTMILRDGLMTALAGLALGAALSVLMSQAVSAMAFGVTLTSPSVWVVVIGVVLAATTLAAWRPALQAAKADPISLLRDN